MTIAPDGLRCGWCGRPFEPTAGAGRPRKYCRRSCRQRDYETRRRAAELGLGEDELIVTRRELDELRDRMYVLAQTLQDVERDLVAGKPDDEARILGVLVEACRTACSAAK